MYQVGDLRSAFRTKGASPYVHVRARYMRVFYDVYHAGYNQGTRSGGPYSLGIWVRGGGGGGGGGASAKELE